MKIGWQKVLERLDKLEKAGRRHRNEMTLEEKIRGLIQEFRQAYYGEDVRRTYADIAELVCIEAMKKAGSYS